MASINPKAGSSFTLSIFIGVISAIILSFLFWWIYWKPVGEQRHDWVFFLPYLNCLLNSLTTSLLVCGYRAIKKGERERHKSLMLSAVGTSALFLVSYLLYHHYHGDTKFLREGIVRIVYFSILISHILLSIVQIPLILGTLWFAFQGNWPKHKKVARVTFPVWLYVSVTGVLIFLMLKVFN